MKKLFYLLFALPAVAFSQQEVRTYYDSLGKRHLQEVYYVAKDDPEKLVGKYVRYYRSGPVMVEGNFDDGNKSGPFTEYFENGKPARKVSFVNGMRHGPVEIFNDTGVPVQKAYYQNDKLTDSIQLYFDNGNLKEIGRAHV